jgi:pumilio RNA-binding family
MRNALQNMQFHIHQPELQFVTVGWAPILVPVDSQDMHLPVFDPFSQEVEDSDYMPNYTLASSSTDTVPTVSSPSAVLKKHEAAAILEKLSRPKSSEFKATIAWVIQSAWRLANSYEGSRIVQRAFEVADATELVALRESLQGNVMEASMSPHANFVLQKCIEVIPAAQLGFMIEEMQGNVAFVAKHRFGCRILERLIEHHCAALPIEDLMDEIVAQTAILCRHSFANFVVKHVLEHGTDLQRAQIIELLLQDVCRLAKHRVASHVVQSALVYASAEDRARLKQAMSSDSTELEDIRKTQCGRFVVEEMVRA